MPIVDQFGRLVPRDRAYRFGRIISQVFHPILNGIATFMLVGVLSPGLPNVIHGLTWAGACILTIVLPPAIYFYLRLFRGGFSDDDVSRRSERNALYAVSLLSTIVASVVLYLLGLPPIFLRLLGAALVINVVCMLINFYWKISVHSASIAALSTVATLLLTRLGIVLWLCALGVGWARIRTGNHTVLQVLAGWGVAVAVTVLALRIGM